MFFFDKSKLVQITGNLISNAIKFTPAGGTVSVDLAIEINDSAITLRICVQDSGIGIPAQTVRNITEGTASSTNGTFGERGYGFGLPLVKHLVDSFDGSMQIFSRLGGGTRFEIELPQKNDAGLMALPELVFKQSFL